MTLTVAVVFPELLGTYGDRGNALVLAARARWRGFDAALVDVAAGERLPHADIYCLGGGEDGPEQQAAESLRRDRVFADAVGRGVPVIGVCGGYQILGRTFPAPGGAALPGVGALDVETTKGPGPRAVGELLVQSAGEGDGTPGGRGVGSAPARLGALRRAEKTASALPPPVVLSEALLTGFENHAGVTRRAPGVAPLGTVLRGVGNGDGTEGARVGHVVGTYLHGPVLARNPALADLLLSWATDAPLAPLDDVEEEALRAERIASALQAPRRDWGVLGRSKPGRARRVARLGQRVRSAPSSSARGSPEGGS